MSSRTSGECLERLYRDELASLVRMIAVRCDPITAEDVVQEAFLRAIRYAGNDESKLNRRYLYAIAVNVLLAEMQHRKQRPGDKVPGDPSEVISGDAEADRLYGSLADLPRDQFNALLLRSVKGLTWRETGDAMQTSPEAARRHHSRGVEAMRSALEDQPSKPAASSRGRFGRAG